MKRLLVLTIFLSLTQVASAERWQGLIASVAALEAARKPIMVPLSFTEPPLLLPITELLPIPLKQKTKKVCENGVCRLIPITDVKVTRKTATSKKKRRFFRRRR
ncbi:hypothetical protein LCGC14_1281130 [marine sediment metagenome]|uniref:Uncharacterized protein n=1 Tax=marine sediment metagenome TaxID=412755 RepID=A0A0F9KWS6_9ZZZZ